jgi:uncharacterized protein YgbK (DUF1537 family)
MRGQRRPRVGVVADDITGAGDIGGLFALHGLAVRVLGSSVDPDDVARRMAGVRADVLVLDTDSRFDPPARAQRKVRRATEALARWGATLFFKKTCSVFRGNVGAEIDAMLDELDEPFTVAVAAFPRNGRTTLAGVHRVHGRPLAESEFARDPVHPRTESNLVTDLGRQTARRVDLVPIDVVRGGTLASHLFVLRAGGCGVALCDGETQEDLAIIARACADERVLVGSSALAEELPRSWTPAPPFDAMAGAGVAAAGGVLVIAGSVMPQTAAQVAALAAAGVVVHTLDSDALLADAEAVARAAATRAAAELAAGRDAVVRADATPDAVAAARALGAARGLGDTEVSRIVSGTLARVAELTLAASPAAGLVVLGGDTSAAVCARIGLDETVIVEEIEAGLPLSLAPARRLLVVLKSGSFGSPDFVLRAIDRLLTRAGRPPRSDRTASGG